MDDPPRSTLVRGELDEGSLFLESQPMWRNTIVRLLVPFEVLISSAVLLLIASQVPQSRVTLLIVWALACVALPAMVFFSRLRTDLTRDTLRVSLFPLVYWRIPTRRIVRAERINVDPMKAFGGWGLKFTKRYGAVLNIKGRDHVTVELNNGKKRTIGTQDPEALLFAINAVCGFGETPVSDAGGEHPS